MLINPILERLNACYDARQWATGKTVVEAWNTCQRPDWMFWLLGRASVPVKTIALTAVDIAESVAHHAAKYPAVRECIDVVRKYLAGGASLQELLAARSAAQSARFAAESAARSAAQSARSAAESAARSAAESAAQSAAWSAAESAAQSAAWSAAESAARSAAWSAARFAWSAAQSAACDVIRRHVPDVTIFLSVH
jgi:hypothetical protein